MTAVVKKALSLLSLFTERAPEYGLSEIGRLAMLDKATTHRLLRTLREAGLVEQNPATKLYRLGPTILSLARVREATFPFVSVVQPALERLSDLTGETAHCSLHTHNALAVMAFAESKKATRVSMRDAETLPFHATASGIAYLAFAPNDSLAEALKLPLVAYTAQTYVRADQVQDAIAVARQTGYATVDKSFEDEVVGIAAPLFGSDQRSIGAIAVAVPSHRLTHDTERQIAKHLLSTAVHLCRQFGNAPPADFLRLAAAFSV